MKQLLVEGSYEGLTEEQKVFFCQENDVAITDDERVISIQLYIYKHDREFYEKYKLLFDEKDIKTQLAHDMLMRGTKWELYGVTDAYKF